ncbi:glycosyltransferase family 39 protein [Pseudoruegeria sp. HB172150]|uniref:ArnT family glycosyltransferase n=1 Tax=Pseudoruegeria sp. HB172150 TaxID=2721164 RepID=UPI00155770AB|nr:glycosyltransferase family 39 protein [Pseudoruegeria sp. HB172150]
MQRNVTPPDTRDWPRRAALAVLAITAVRVLLLAFNRTDLFVDEAQYWLWGEELAFGYYSKPPLIGWVLAFFTAFSDGTFWVRLPGPLFHGATAMIIGSIAHRLYGGRTAFFVAVSYVTLPMVALASLLISTDTIMFPFLAGSLACYLRLLDKKETRFAVLTGLLLGLAFLGKYAAIYYPICAALAALVFHEARPSRRHIGILLGVFAVTILPNLIWNVLNGFSTLSHTLDNADWVRAPGSRAGLHPGALAEFFLSQFAVFGPVLFSALLIVAATAKRRSPVAQFLLIFSIPILLIVCVQALLSRAYANWAAAAYIAGLLVAVPWLMGRHRRWMIASFAINGFFCVVLPLLTLFPEQLKIRGQQVLSRYTGRAEMSETILDIATDLRVGAIVAENRDVLADLFYTGRDSGIGIYAIPPQGRAPHHYAQKHPYVPDGRDVLLVQPPQVEVPCPEEVVELAEMEPEDGAYRDKPQMLYLVPGVCIAAP